MQMLRHMRKLMYVRVKVSSKHHSIAFTPVLRVVHMPNIKSSQLLDKEGRKLQVGVILMKISEHV